MFLMLIVVNKTLVITKLKHQRSKHHYNKNN